MKSSIDELRKRGYIEDIDIDKFYLYKESDLLEMMKSEESYKRTLARLIKR